MTKHAILHESAVAEGSLITHGDYLISPAQPQTYEVWKRVRASLVTDRLLLAVGVSAGAFLRLWQLNGLGYNSDEAVYAGQAAGIIDDPALKPFFPVFRAHPMLFQFLVSLGFRFGVIDWVGRLFAVAFGLATLYVVFHLGVLLYGRRAGVYATLFLALMPYHVVVTRQVLLDGPMTFFTTLTLYLLARFARTQQPVWLVATGAGLGLTFLTKETGIIMIGAIYAFLALSPQLRVRIRDLVLSLAATGLIMAAFPLSLYLAGGKQSAQSYLIWQLFRRPNHEWTFYPEIVSVAIGPLLILVALAGLWLLRHEHSWRERLLLAWILVPALFFQLWPTKGFQYLLPIAPAFALLAARTLAALAGMPLVRRRLRRMPAAGLSVILAGVVAVTLLVPSWTSVQGAASDQFLAGSAGVPGGREAGLWIGSHLPRNARLVAIGPSMANVLQFYGHRKVYGLSVSPNPLRRNPSYDPILNPDLQIRTSEVQYLVWDSFSAARTPFFAQTLKKYADRFQGRVVHTESLSTPTPSGATTQLPIIIIYEVRP